MLRVRVAVLLVRPEVLLFVSRNSIPLGVQELRELDLEDRAPPEASKMMLIVPRWVELLKHPPVISQIHVDDWFPTDGA